MADQAVQLSSKHQKIIDRFLTACQADERIVAAFLVGSNAKGQADEHSDLDLYAITTDEAFDDFAATRESFVRLLGEPAFVEDFGIPNILFLIFPDGSEVELYYTSQNRAGRAFNAPYKVLLDKKNISSTIVPVDSQDFDEAKQTEQLRRLITGFWHDFSHFVTALARNQLWWASGQLEVLRAMCVGLARLQNDFSDPEVTDEVYFKIENAMPVEQLASLKETFCSMDRAALLKAGFIIVDFYRELAVPLAQAHGIPYAQALENVMVERLKQVRNNP